MNDFTYRFYRSKKWTGKRKNILRRDKYMCIECKKYGRRVEAQTVHHIKHLEDYPKLALENNNLISVCNSCHNKLHPEKGKR